jgi:hypothetical protein
MEKMDESNSASDSCVSCDPGDLDADYDDQPTEMELDDEFEFQNNSQTNVWATMGVHGMTQSKRININSLKVARGAQLRRQLIYLNMRELQPDLMHLL